MGSILRLAGCLLIFHVMLAKGQLRIVQEWNEMEFQFPSEETKAEAISSNHYIPGASFIIDTDVNYRPGGKTRVFVTLPRFGEGRPMTLGVITKVPGSGGSLIAPYPDYSWHNNQGHNCDGITSVLRIAIDECSRLWVLDTGKIDEVQHCSPQLLAFDLKTDRLILRHRFTTEVRQNSIFVTPIVDVRDPTNGCQNTFVYIADVTGFAIIVYDLSTGTSWRVTDKLLFPHPPQGTFNIAGESFELMDGVLGMALSPFKDPASDRLLYFHALASITENIVKTSVLRNASAWQDDLSNPKEFIELPGRRSSQAAAEVIDRNGIMFFGLASPTALACWDTSTKFSPANIDIVATNDVTLQFASGMKVVTNLKGGQELWVVTCRFQKIMTGTMTSEEVNYRVMAANVQDLIKGTKCNRPNGQAAHLSNLVSGTISSSYGGASYH